MQIHLQDQEKIKKLKKASKAVRLEKKGRMQGYASFGKLYPRVTSVLQYDGSKAMALMEWAKRETVSRACQVIDENYGNISKTLLLQMVEEQALAEADEQRDTAASRGTIVHNELEKFLKSLGKITQYNSIDPRVQQFVEIWNKKYRQNSVVVALELPLIWHSADYEKGFGGTMDFLSYEPDGFWLNDFKTSRSFHGSYAVQLAAYRKALKQMADIDPVGYRGFHFPDVNDLKDWQLKEHQKLGNEIELTNMDKAEETFMYLLNLWYNRNEKYILKK